MSLSSNPASATPSRRQWALIAVLVAYAGLSQYSASAPNGKALGAALSLGPVALIAVVLAWRWTRPLPALALTLGLGWAAFHFWPSIERHFEWADLIEQVGIYALVSLGFLRSLFTPHTPLCALLAEKMHGQLTPVEASYMRRATLVWGLFYGLLTLAISILFWALPYATWSLFVNVGTFGLMFAMGVVDHYVRRRLLPRHEKSGLLQLLRQALIG